MERRKLSIALEKLLTDPAIGYQTETNKAKILDCEDKLKAITPSNSGASFQEVIAQSAGIPPPPC